MFKNSVECQMVSMTSACEFGEVEQFNEVVWNAFEIFKLLGC